MSKRTAVLLAATLLLASSGFAKDKKRILPAYVLNAHSVAVIIDPDAGLSVEDPQANTVAQKDVERALVAWGRFEPMPSTRAADLIIVVRKGSGRIVNQTVTDTRQNRRPGDIDATDSTVTLGAQHGQQPGLSGDASSTQTASHSQTELGATGDSFLVYEGGVDNPLDHSPAWRYVAEDGLRPHTVPAVAEFRKALAEAEKVAAKNP